MANNSTIQPNSTGLPIDYDYTDFYDSVKAVFLKMHIIDLVTQSVFCLVGTFLNVWFIASIVTSRQLRQKLRNQFLCNMALSHLIQTLIQSPITIVYTLHVLDLVDLTFNHICHMFGFRTNLAFIVSFIEDWLLLFITVSFLAHTLDFDLETRLGLRMRTSFVCKLVLHVAPWLVAAVVTPSAISVAKIEWSDCHIVPTRNIYIFEIVYTVIPLAVCGGLLVLACVLWYKRYSDGTSAGTAAGTTVVGDSMGEQLMGTAQVRENWLAYALSLAVAIFVEVFWLIVSFDPTPSTLSRWKFIIFAYVITDSRVILSPIPWLLLPDIRQRITRWRPWRSSAPSDLDLAVTYTKDT